MRAGNTAPSDGKRIAFVQPFGVSSPGGGSRILRALLAEAPVNWMSICSMPEAPPKTLGEEIHLPARPFTGRLERTRFSGLANALGPIFAGRFQRNLESVCERGRISAVHAIAHSSDFVYARRAAAKHGAPYFLSVHDDPEWALSILPDSDRLIREMGEAWRCADGRYVISEQMGRECCSRYGERPFAMVTDGVTKLGTPRLARPAALDIYFMGLFHVSYEQNLEALLAALQILERENPKIEPSLTLRCGSLRTGLTGDRRVKVLPFAGEATVQADLEKASLVYLPLPFTAGDRALARFSLSTKMITYLGSGVPIFYHGPREAAACDLLQKSNAAFTTDSLDPAAIATALREVFEDAGAKAGERARNALDLARSRFMLADQLERFWGPIMETLNRS